MSSSAILSRHGIVVASVLPASTATTTATSSSSSSSFGSASFQVAHFDTHIGRLGISLSLSLSLSLSFFLSFASFTL